MIPISVFYEYDDPSGYLHSGNFCIKGFAVGEVITDIDNFFNNSTSDNPNVHLNPVRTVICKNLHILERYQWCGHGVLRGWNKRKFQDVRTVLRQY